MDDDVKIDESDLDMLSNSWFTRILLFSFQAAATYGSFIFFSSAFFILVPSYNLSVTWNSAVAYIYITVEIGATMLVGYYGDRVISRWGKRKPLVLIGYLLNCVASIFLAQLSVVNIFTTDSRGSSNDDGEGYSKNSLHSLIVPNSNNEGMGTFQVWFLFCQLINALGTPLYQIPFNSWFFESTKNVDDYSTIQLWCFNLGTAFGYILAILTLYQYPQTALSWGAVSTIGFGLPLLVAITYFIHNRVIRDEDGENDRVTNQDQDQDKVDITINTQNNQRMRLDRIRDGRINCRRRANITVNYMSANEK